jgi:hypothetical protein
MYLKILIEGKLRALNKYYEKYPVFNLTDYYKQHVKIGNIQTVNDEGLSPEELFTVTAELLFDLENMLKENDLF